MTKFRRRLLFYGLVFVFLPLSGWLTLRAQGFSLDFQGGTLAEYGALFLRIEPANAAIYLDDERYESSGGVFRTQAFITNLIPGAHRVVVVKDGYHRWEKTFAVKPLGVVDAPTVRLFPRAPRIEPVTSSQLPVTSDQLFTLERARRQLPETASSTLFSLDLNPAPMSMVNGQWSNVTLLYRDLLLSPDQKKALVRTRNELWVIWLKKERLNGIHQPGEIERVVMCEEEISDAVWLQDDSHHVIFSVGGPSTKFTPSRVEGLGANKIKIAELDGRGGRNVVDLLEAENTRFFFEPETQKLLFTEGEKFFRLTL